MVRILGIDASSSGAAGDMIVSALFGLIEEKQQIRNKLQEMLSSLFNEPVSFEFVELKRNGFKGFQLKGILPEKHLDNEEISQILEGLTQFLGEKGKSVMLKAWNLLIQAEKEVHGIEKIHLHELGAFDTVFDLFASSFLIDRLDPSQIWISPINTGMGTVKTEHGILPVPSPATQKILEACSLPTRSEGEGELLTPTGAALIGAMKETFELQNQAIWKKSSFGFGTKTIDDRLNGVRLRLGENSSTNTNIIVLETNVDDISGELLGDAVTRLIKHGALDVLYIPIFTKKNRPGWQIQVISPIHLADELAKYLMQLTGTLGIRFRQVARHIGERVIEQRKIFVDGKIFSVRVKKGPFTRKIEYEDIKRIAEKTQKTPLEVLQTYKFVDDS